MNGTEVKFHQEGDRHYATFETPQPHVTDDIMDEFNKNYLEHLKGVEQTAQVQMLAKQAKQIKILQNQVIGFKKDRDHWKEGYKVLLNSNNKLKEERTLAIKFGGYSEQVFTELQETIQEKDAIIKSFEEAPAAPDNDIADLAVAFDKELKARAERNVELKKTIEERDETIQSHKANYAFVQEENKALKGRIEVQKGTISEQNKELVKAEKEYKELSLVKDRIVGVSKRELKSLNEKYKALNNRHDALMERVTEAVSLSQTPSPICIQGHVHMGGQNHYTGKPK